MFKGGTSLRKRRLGNDGRFSTDLDFAAPNEDTVLEVCGIIDGARVAGFEYRLESDRGDGRHWLNRAGHPPSCVRAVASGTMSWRPAARFVR